MIKIVDFDDKEIIIDQDVAKKKNTNYIEKDSVVIISMIEI